MTLRPVFAAILIAVTAGCSQPVEPDLGAEEQAIRELDAKWLEAEQARDAASAAAVLADDGVAYRQHIDPLVGPAAYEVYEAQFLADNPNADVYWSTEMVQVAASGDMAVQTGEYHLTGLGPNGDGEDRGRFVTVWKKVGDQWKIAHDIGSTTMPEVDTKE